MSLTKRATIYLDADLHRAVRMKAVEIDESVSDLVNAAPPAKPRGGCRRSRCVSYQSQRATPRFRGCREGPQASWQAIGCSSSRRPAKTSKPSRSTTAVGSSRKSRPCRVTRGLRGVRNSRGTTDTEFDQKTIESCTKSMIRISSSWSSRLVIVVMSTGSRPPNDPGSPAAAAHRHFKSPRAPDGRRRVQPDVRRPFTLSCTNVDHCGACFIICESAWRWTIRQPSDSRRNTIVTL